MRGAFVRFRITISTSLDLHSLLSALSVPVVHLLLQQISSSADSQLVHISLITDDTAALLLLSDSLRRRDFQSLVHQQTSAHSNLCDL